MASASEPTATADELTVLSLVTYPRPFYVEEITALRARGVTVDVVAVPGLDAADESRSLSDYLRFYRTVLGRAPTDYDLVHANYGLTVPFALAQPHRPVVASLWGSDVMGSLDWVAKRSAGRCAERIVMSEEMRGELGHDAHIIPHGIDFETFRPMEQAAAREAVGWEPDGTFVLFPYDPDRPVKDYPRAERVVADVQADTDESIALKPVFGVDHDMVPQYMNAADALLLTSRHEGFPNAIKEAMACELPVVSTDVGGLRDRLAPVDNSYVCESDAELAGRLADVLASGRRSDGRTHTADLSLESTTDRILDVYTQALSR